MKGTLYLCATPIGNMEDITLRSLNVLKSVDLIAAEDTRRTIKLLNHYQIDTPLTSYHKFNRENKGQALLIKAQAGQSVALVSDAGLPGISDPGEELVSLFLANDLPVVALPGPTAAVTALVISGLPTGRFAFEGFLPRKGPLRKKRLNQLAAEERTIILYEAPHRLLSTLNDLKAALDHERQIAVAREMTKKFEEVWRGSLEQAYAYFDEHSPKGEFTLVVAGKEAKHDSKAPDAAELTGRAEKLRAQGLSARDAADIISLESGLPRRQVYQTVIKKGGS